MSTAGQNHFLSFLEGISLRHPLHDHEGNDRTFPILLEGLSLRPFYSLQVDSVARGFPFLFGRAFIEAHQFHGL